MAHPYHHAQSSARRYGGVAEDYIAIHTWFDASKSQLALPQHRAVRHHAAGIFEAEALFGATLTNSAGRIVPTRFIGEQHVKEDCRCIPTLADWLSIIPLEPWMANGRIDDATPEPLDDPKSAWVEAVAASQTILGFQDWLAERDLRKGAAQSEM